MDNVDNSLLSIVGRISKYSGVKPAFDAIATGNHNPMSICLQKLVIE